MSIWLLQRPAEHSERYVRPAEAVEMPAAPGIVQRDANVAGVAGVQSILAAHRLSLDGGETGKIRNPRHLPGPGSFNVRRTGRPTGRVDTRHQFECAAVSRFFCFTPIR